MVFIITRNFILNFIKEILLQKIIGFLLIEKEIIEDFILLEIEIIEDFIHFTFNFNSETLMSMDFINWQKEYFTSLADQIVKIVVIVANY